MLFILKKREYSYSHAQSNPHHSGVRIPLLVERVRSTVHHTFADDEDDIMGTKLSKDTFPTGHSPNDFECFGPPASRDGEFETTRICDMGCFTQDGKDSNKRYHAAVVK